jgi:hypothetical protein
MYLPANKQFGPEGAELVMRSKLPYAALAGGRDEHAAADQCPAAGHGVQANLEPCGPRLVATAFLCVAGWHPCRAGIVAGFLGDLWSGLVLRHAANAGDWNPHGPGCYSHAGLVWGGLEDIAAGICWYWCRNCGFNRSCPPDCFASVWDCPTYPFTVGGMVVLLGTVAMLAGYLPARRASRIDPMIGLRTN